MKSFFVGILVSLVLIGGAMYVAINPNPDNNPAQTADNVTVIDGQQIIEISAKGGYAPRISTAQAGLPTVLKLTTNGTFDCSSAVTIPSLNYRQNLPPSGSVTVDIPPQKPGAVLRGLCSMGMYHFTVNFN